MLIPVPSLEDVHSDDTLVVTKTVETGDPRRAHLVASAAACCIDVNLRFAAIGLVPVAVREPHLIRE